ncbi:MAG: acyl--CoA ligase [Bacteroidaceae bacterium]|nr:acyl--CoA ligase [Bacteroidaceae bacterium]
MKRLEDFIARHVARQPDKPALMDSATTLTYAALWTAVERRAETMRLHPDVAWVERVSQTADFLVTYLAAHLSGKVIVPLEHDLPDELFLCIQEQAQSCPMPDGVADVLFTTGTTGRQKGVMVSHRAILANAQNLVEAQGFSSRLTFVVCGPLNHLGSLSKVWATLLAGGTLRILEGMKDMDAFFHTIRSAATPVATFLVPTSIRMVLQFGRETLADLAHKMEFLETGAAPLSQPDMETLCRLLPHSRLYNTYASTETGIIATHNYNEGHCVAGCLGRPMRHASLSFTSDGYIVCGGDTLMSGYLGDAELTQSVLRDGLCYTRDRGDRDAEGRLQLMGRDDDLINVGGYKVNPAEVEACALTMESVGDCICVTAPHPVLGTALRLLVVVRGGVPLDKRALARHLSERLEGYKVPQLYTQVDAVRRTYNGKLDRKSYRTVL